jgi:hypothetical protein
MIKFNSHHLQLLLLHSYAPQFEIGVPGYELAVTTATRLQPPFFFLSRPTSKPYG